MLSRLGGFQPTDDRWQVDRHRYRVRVQQGPPIQVLVLVHGG